MTWFQTQFFGVLGSVLAKLDIDFGQELQVLDLRVWIQT